MPTIIRKTAIALLLAIAGAVTASAGQYYDLAVKAFETGDYERCIELFEKKIPAEIKQYKKEQGFVHYSWWPYVESAFAMKDFKRAYKGINKHILVLDQKKDFAGRSVVPLTPSDLERWPLGKNKEVDYLLNYLLDIFFHRYSYDVEAFRKSPFIKHIANANRYTVNDLVAKAAEVYFQDSKRGLEYHGAGTLDNLCWAADFGHVVATRVVANAFEQGYIDVNGGENIPVSVDKEKAFYYWKKNSESSAAAGMERMVALYKCAEMFMYGKGTEKDPAAAIGYFDKVIEGISEKNFYKSAAYKNRAQCYMEMGDTVSFFNKNKEALEAGCNSVAHNLGNCYKSGHGTDIDYNKAFEAYSAGLEKQDALSPVVPCQWEVGMLLRDGKGCPPDPERALELFKSASDAGWIFAQYTLAEEYYKRQQWTEAMNLCRLVTDSDKRIPNAARASVCKMMARMYTHGRGVEADEAQAQQWWNRAASYGDDDAEIIRQWLGIK